MTSTLEERKRELRSLDPVRVRAAMALCEGDEQAFALVLETFRALARTPDRRVFLEAFAERPDARYEPPLWEVLLAPAHGAYGVRDRAAALNALAARRGLAGLPASAVENPSESLFWTRSWIRVLGSLGDRRVVSVLREAFEEQDDQFSDKARLLLIATLERLGGDEAASLLAALLDDGTRAVVEAAQTALVSMGPSAVPGLLSYLGTAEDDGGLRRAVQVLVQLGALEVVPLLLENAESWHPFALEQLLALGEAGVRAMATPPGLMRSMHEHAAAQMAAQGERFRPLLLELLGSASGEGRGLAVTALAELGGPGLLELLRSVIEKSPAGDPARSAAVRALGHRDDPAVLPLVRTALGDGDREVQSAAAEALGRQRDHASVPALGELLSSPHEQVRVGALHALGLLRAEAVRDQITPLRNDPHPKVREEAEAVLRALASGAPR